MTWNDTNTQTLKYLALGILIGYLSPYLMALIKKQSTKKQSTQNTNQETVTNES